MLMNVYTLISHKICNLKKFLAPTYPLILSALSMPVSFATALPFEEPDCSSVLKFGVGPPLYFTTSKKGRSVVGDRK